MKNKIKSEILSLILMIVNFEVSILAFDCYFRPINDYDYLWGSVLFIGLIMMITLTCVQKVNINRLIDELNDTEDVIVISK